MQSIRMLLVLLSLCPLHELWAQTEAKNPKVAEVEAYLSQKIITYMNSRFPSMPVLVFVQSPEKFCPTLTKYPRSSRLTSGMITNVRSMT
jgi:hypothetical protein